MMLRLRQRLPSPQSSTPSLELTQGAAQAHFAYLKPLSVHHTADIEEDDPQREDSGDSVEEWRSATGVVWPLDAPESPLARYC